MKLRSKGKVRDTYEMMAEDFDGSDGKVLAIVTSDRVSAFDKVIPGLSIDGKGAILTKMSELWADMIDYRSSDEGNRPWSLQFLEQAGNGDEALSVETSYLDTEDTVQEVKEDDIDAFMKEYGDRVQFQIDLLMIPYECIVRGYITGSLWKAYNEDGLREFCGVKLPEGLQESDPLPEPIFTPTTKAPVGQHDENVTVQEMIDDLSVDDIFAPVCEGSKFGSAEAVVNVIEKISLFFYQKAADYAIEHGIIIADTKFEFGFGDDGCIYLGDEILTPDSSRFWPAAEYEPGRAQKSLDKQIIRDYIKREKELNKGEEINDLPPEIVWQTKDAYQKICDMLFPCD